MRTDAGQDDATDTPDDADVTRRLLVSALARGARLLATPAAIVVAWLVVVSQWNSSDEQLFNWATTTAAIVLGVVTGAWLLSLKFPALRRALLPFEGGLVVGAVVLAAATQGREVDMLGDRMAIAFTFGVIAALLLAFMQQLVAGRRRARAWLGGVVVVCMIVGIAVPATLDWLERDTLPGVYAVSAGEVIARATDDGFRIDDVSLRYGVSSLATGYFDDMALAGGSIYAESVVPMDPATGETFDPATGEPIADPAPVGDSSASGPNLQSDWAQLLVQSDGAIRLVVTQAVADGIDERVIGSLRSGSCQTAGDAKVLAGFDIPKGTEYVERDLSITVEDLRLGDQLSIVVGTERPLAPTRCLQLLTSSGIVLAQLGAASFVEECVEPLDLPSGSEYRVRASSFQEPACARRFDEYSRISSSLLVPRSRLAAYRRCHRTHEAGIETTERPLPNDAVAVTYPDDVYGSCFSFGANAATLGGFANAGPVVPGPEAGIASVAVPAGSIGMADSAPMPPTEDHVG